MEQGHWGQAFLIVVIGGEKHKLKGQRSKVKGESKRDARIFWAHATDFFHMKRYHFQISFT